MGVADLNRVVFTGENHFISLNHVDSDDHTSVASFWRVAFCPGGPGHVLFLRSELAGSGWRIHSDNVAAARWLQRTVQGMLVTDLKDETMPVVEAAFARSDDPRASCTERVSGRDEILLTWHDLGEPLLIHTQPDS